MTDIAPAPAPAPSTVDASLPTFGPQWPGPGRVAPPAVLVTIIVVAVASAAMVSWDKFGIGWLATGLVAAFATTVVVIQSRVAGQDRPARREDVLRAMWALLALTLLAAGAVRAAEWLWVLCLPAALFCGVMAVVGGRTVRGVTVGTLVVPIAAILGLAWAARGFSAMRGRSGSSAARVAAAVALSVALLLIFGSLLASADVVFQNVLDSFLPEINGGTIGRWLWNALFFGVAALSACYLAIRPPDFNRGNPSTVERRTVGRIEWAVPVGTLVLLFAGFVAVQATVLFGGADHVLKTAGLTYAEYARQGFWQLLGVTVLTLLVIAVAVQFAARATVPDRVWLRTMFGALAVLTLVIVASAISRMLAYQDAYGFTRLRLLVIVCEGWLGLVFVFVLLAGIRLRAPWLPRSIIAAAALALVGIVAANPDYLIAQQNLARYDRIGRIDLDYLSTLSADAVPALNRLSGEERRCVLRDIDQNLDEQGPDEWYEWNLGRQQARDALAGYTQPTATDATNCWDLLRSR